jgi:hypothetical protein
VSNSQNDSSFSPTVVQIYDRKKFNEIWPEVKQKKKIPAKVLRSLSLSRFGITPGAGAIIHFTAVILDHTYSKLAHPSLRAPCSTVSVTTDKVMRGTPLG